MGSERGGGRDTVEDLGFILRVMKVPALRCCTSLPNPLGREVRSLTRSPTHPLTHRDPLTHPP